MNSIPDKSLIEEVALELGITEAFIEKDWYVTQVIKMIAAATLAGFTMVFTGGTALSKAHGLIQRFSEDVDFRVICPDLDLLNGSQQKKRLSDFKKSIVAVLETDFVIALQGVTARNANRFFAIELEYPTFFSQSQSLRPHILVEFTITDLALPSIRLPISSFINKLAGKALEVPAIECIDPVENAADKLSAFVWRISDRVRGDKEKDDPTIVRHIHDLSILSDIAIAHAIFAQLAITIIKTDDGRCKKIEGLSLKEKFETVIGIIEKEKGQYKEEYTVFVQGMSYAKDGIVQPFGQALQKVRDLIAHVLAT
ncbi:Nucleotidyl transferase AbiEii toxin, Type IV TA system [Chitinophaga costaii]|uniref:Nucleotidyl transferase AbiEii toxin, Type IV TA system n=1 Tax=Chitinophaga costaii TaxID=1335309 RepID=A0A1C3YRE9_9BACT|nr:nucleotidyl transferase AbiEii/AbiGii toxin family protein [Chitinophaga costaii]PUZ30071.1 nucleotidyl transferase AbiEii/AbiGii toxin family protein [Chitinophaga costaii]SCB72659.1 Nucleotidyl transferase AbiEii toxin, Type IV TA system [Chitinophaga costaii]